MTWEKLPTAGVSMRTLKHSSAALGENIYVYGGILDGVPTDDLMMFNTGVILVNKFCKIKLYKFD